MKRGTRFGVGERVAGVVMLALLGAAGCGASKAAPTGAAGSNGGGAGTPGGPGTSGGAGTAGGAGTSPDASTDSGAPDGGAPDGGGSDAAAIPTVIGPLTFAISATGPDRFYGVAYDTTGNIFAVGQIASSNDANADIATVVAKFSAQGVPDATFGTNGVVVRNVATGTNGELFRGIVVQSTGKVVVSGTADHAGAADPRDRDIALMRFNTDGTKDTSFGTDGILTVDLSTGVVNGTAFSADSAWGLARYADDRLVVSGGQVRTGGLDTDFALVRLTADGARDATFGANGVFTLDTQTDGVSNNASPRNVTILPGTDGVIGAGYQPLVGGDTKPALYRVSDTGVLDTTFGTNGVFSTPVLAEQTETYQAVVQPDPAGGYKLVTTGYGRSAETETTDLLSLRLDAHGVLDTTYGTNGFVRVDVGGFGDNSRRLVVLPDRRIMFVGGGRPTAANVDGVVELLLPDGAPDTRLGPKGWKTFDLGGPADFLWSIALSPDGKTAAVAGIKGVGTTPTPPSANDDTALLILPIPQ